MGLPVRMGRVPGRTPRFPVPLQVKIQPPELKGFMDKKLSSEC